MKLLEPAQNFQLVLEQFTWIPRAALAPLAGSIPWIEWIAGGWLLVGFLSRPAAAVLGLLSLSFIVILSGPVWTGQGLAECGCFGTGTGISINQAYMLDWVNLILAAFLLTRSAHPFALENRIR
jgi:uncharacterized membrane protein YphA (DoxX/SURF4 family)